LDRPAGATNLGDNLYPIDVEAMGEWVAWTVTYGSTGMMRDRKIAIKNFHDPSRVEPTFITFNGFFAWRGFASLSRNQSGLIRESNV
jgi:hypothetical protein